MWLIISLFPPLLYVFGFLIDKYVLSIKKDSISIEAIVVLSGLFSFIALPLIFFFEQQPLLINSGSAILLMLNGGLTLLAVWLYLHATSQEEVFSVVTVLQTVPLFGLLIAFILLGEVITLRQAMGALCILIAAGFLATDQTKRYFLNKKNVLLGLLSALVFALSGVLFKVFALENGYWRTEFWEYVGILLATLLMLVFSNKTRECLKNLFRKRNYSAVGLTLLSESFIVMGDLALNFATLLAPVGLVLVVNALQPGFLFVFTLTGLLFFPLAVKQIKQQHTLTDVFLVVIMFSGALLLYT